MSNLSVRVSKPTGEIYSQGYIPPSQVGSSKESLGASAIIHFAIIFIIYYILVEIDGRNYCTILN